MDYIYKIQGTMNIVGGSGPFKLSPRFKHTYALIHPVK
jgi:hypothetical protein